MVHDWLSKIWTFWKSSHIRSFYWFFFFFKVTFCLLKHSLQLQLGLLNSKHRSTKPMHQSPVGSAPPSLDAILVKKKHPCLSLLPCHMTGSNVSDWFRKQSEQGAVRRGGQTVCSPEHTEKRRFRLQDRTRTGELLIKLLIKIKIA